MKAALVKKEEVTKDTLIFWFKPEKPISYIAGQYTEIHLPHENPDERKTKRWFTLSSSPTETMLAITTRFNNKHPSSFKTRLKNLEIGESVTMMPPMGDFVLPKDSSLPILFIAGGIGITPYRSMLKYLLDTVETRNIKLLYTVHKKEYAAFEDIIKASPAEYRLNIGRLSVADIQEYLDGTKEQAIYISGPEKMVENLQRQLFACGVDSRQLRVDFFHNYD